MSSFFEKLKAGMGLEEPELAEMLEQEKPQEKKRRSVRQASPPVKGEAKKITVKDEGRQGGAKTNAVAAKEEWPETEGELAVDVYQTDDEIVVQSAIAGIKPEDLDITVERDTVTIKGERGNTTTKESKNYFHQECFWGAFSRQIILPEEVNPAMTEASMKNGILTLRLPKADRQKIKKVQVKG